MLFQPQYSYVDGDGTVPAESAKVLILNSYLLLQDSELDK